MSKVDRNDNVAVTAVLHEARTTLAKLGLPLVVVTTSNRQGRPRGSSALVSLADVVLCDGVVYKDRIGLVTSSDAPWPVTTDDDECDCDDCMGIADGDDDDWDNGFYYDDDFYTPDDDDVEDDDW